MTNRNARAREIFYESLDYPPSERAAFLNQVCDDDEVRRFTEALLKGHESPVTFLEQPIVDRTPLETMPSSNGSTDEKTPALELEGSASPPLAHGYTRYHVLRSHAQGGLGEVYIAKDSELNREVALKEIRNEYAHDKNFADRFLLEAHVTGHLEHPGIVPVYGAGWHRDGRPYYVMRFIHGESFDNAIRRFHTTQTEADPSKRSVAFRELLGQFIDVCQAVAYAHSKLVIHRDLKPKNVMLGRFGETLIVDWGLARILDSPEPNSDHEVDSVRPTAGPTVTRAGSALGTPAYMSPEQATGDRDRVGPASDVYSLGAILYEILTGKPSVDGNLLDVVDQIQQGQFPPPRDVNSNVSPALEAICLKAMSTNPCNRYADALDLARDVESWLADEPPSAWCEPFHARVARWMRKNQRLTTASLTLTFVSVIAVAVVGIWYEKARAHQEARRSQVSTATTFELDRVEEVLDGLSKSLSDPNVVQSFLSDFDEWRRQVETARTAWERAKLVAGDDEIQVDAAVHERLESLLTRIRSEEKHLKLAERLDHIRLDAATMDGKGVIAIATAGPKYAAVFQEVLGVDIERDDPSLIADRIGESPYRTILIAVLDHWAVSSQTINSEHVNILPRILEIARKADPDPWRDRFHDLSIWNANDGSELAKLAKEVDVAAHAPHTLEALVFKLEVHDRRPLLKRALLAYPRDFWLNFAAGRVSKEPAARAGYLQAAIAIRPKTGALYFNLGLALSEYGDSDAAIAAYEKAAKIDPAGAAVAYINLAEIFIKQGRWDQAAKNYQQALTTGAKQAGVRTNLAFCLIQSGQSTRAIEEYRAALKIKPDDGLAYAGLGRVLMRVGQYSEAVEAMQQALRFVPRSHPNHDFLLEKSAQAQAHVALAQEKPTRITLFERHIQVSGEVEVDDPKEASPPNQGSPRVAYVVSLEAGVHYQIDVVGNFRKCLRVEDKNQFCLSFNECVPFVNRRHARLVFSPEVTGDYRVIVAARVPQELGKFTLALSEVREAGAEQIVRVDPPARNASQTQWIAADIDIHFEAGIAYRCELTGKPSPHFAAIGSPDGGMVKQALQIGPRETGMKFFDITPQTTGQYVVQVRSRGNVDNRDYTLSIRKFSSSSGMIPEEANPTGKE